MRKIVLFVVIAGSAVLLAAENLIETVVVTEEK
jgi:hypothetical protein